MKRIFRLYRTISILIISCIVLAAFTAGAGSSFAASQSSKWGKSKFIAHRGLSARAPENTLAAFRLAANKKGFYGVEFDIWESSAETGDEPLLLVMHDPTTKRMCGKKRDIRSITRATLDKYTIINGNKVSKYSDQKIPTLEQTLETIWSGSGGVVPVIELKHRLSSKGLRHLLTCIGDHKAVIISFDFDAVADVEKMAASMGINNRISTMFILKKLSSKKYSSTIKRMKKAGIDCISLKYTAITKKIVKKFHKAGFKVCAWTIPTAKKALKYSRMGVDYLTANDALF